MNNYTTPFPLVQQVDLLLPSGAINLVPFYVIPIDQSQCGFGSGSEPCKDSVPYLVTPNYPLLSLLLPITVTPSPPSYPTQCQAFSEIGNTTSICTANPSCDGVTCSLPGGLVTRVGVLPCNTPPAISLTVEGANGSVLFSRAIDRTQQVPLVGGTSLLVVVNQLPNATIGFQVCALIYWQPVHLTFQPPHPSPPSLLTSLPTPLPPLHTSFSQPSTSSLFLPFTLHPPNPSHFPSSSPSHFILHISPLPPFTLHPPHFPSSSLHTSSSTSPLFLPSHFILHISPLPPLHTSSSTSPLFLPSHFILHISPLPPLHTSSSTSPLFLPSHFILHISPLPPFTLHPPNPPHLPSSSPSHFILHISPLPPFTLHPPHSPHLHRWTCKRLLVQPT